MTAGCPKGVNKMLVEKAIGRYGDTIRNLLPPEPWKYDLDRLMLPLIRELDLFHLALSGEDGELLERIGECYHVERHLGLAATYYQKAVAASPPEPVTDEMMAAVLRHAPLLKLTEMECFPLKDVVAIHHPDKPVIAYHLFWEDDYDFPDDNDPCDHEQVWVAYDRNSRWVTDVWAFYHGSIITTARAAELANEADGRPEIRVQWGKHGSIPAEGEKVRLPRYTVLEDMREAYHQMVAGGRAKDHPIKARFWPAAYRGTWEDFMRFPVTVDSAEFLEAKNFVICSRLSNAVIQQYFLTYNFAAKFGWPWHAPVYDETGPVTKAGACA